MTDLPRKAVRAACDAMRAAYHPATILLSPEAMQAAIQAYLAATEGEREAEIERLRAELADANRRIDAMIEALAMTRALPLEDKP